MINSQIEELEKGSFLARFVSTAPGRWAPAGPRLHAQIELVLQTNRKGECVQAQLCLDARLLDHPVLEPLALSLAQDFLAQGQWEPPPEISSARWLKEPGEARLKGKGATIVRDQKDGRQRYTLSGEKGFLSGWLNR